MHVQKMIWRIDLREEDRPTLDLSGGLRLNACTQRLEVPREPADRLRFQTDATLYAIVPGVTSGTVKRWTGFQVGINNPDSEEDVFQQVGSAYFRIADPDGQFHWDGATWNEVEPDSQLWNTEAEVATNISSFELRSGTISIVVNLRTTSTLNAPSMLWFKLMGDIEANLEYDYIYRTIVPSLMDNIRPIGRFAVSVPEPDNAFIAGLAEITSGMLKSYNLRGISHVYNDTQDPDQRVDIFVAENIAEDRIDLSVAPAANDQLTVYFLYEPEVAVQTSREYVEVAKIPAITLESITITDKALYRSKDLGIYNVGNGEGFILPAPRFSDISFAAEVITSLQYDEFQILRAIQKWMSTMPQLRSNALGISFDLITGFTFSENSSPNKDDVRTGTLTFRLANVVFYDSGAFPSRRAERLVSRFV